MDKSKAAADIIAKALPLVPFDGWTHAMLEQAAAAAGYAETDVVRVFPAGAIDAADAFLRSADRAMTESLPENLSSMKIRERIAQLVRLRLSLMTAHREAVRRALALQALHPSRALSGLYRTVDAIWHAAGDTSTDFNFYTKRLLLAGVYSTSLRVWLDDLSPGQEETWAFLARRIEDVMNIEKAKQQAKRWFKRKAA